MWGATSGKACKSSVTAAKEKETTGSLKCTNTKSLAHTKSLAAWQQGGSWPTLQMQRAMAYYADMGYNVEPEGLAWQDFGAVACSASCATMSGAM